MYYLLYYEDEYLKKLINLIKLIVNK
jgi:hypothetical protein